MMLTGLDQIKDDPSIADGWGRCGLVSNQASVTKDFESSWQVIYGALQKRLTVLFGPQHGFESTVQENMIESEHARHRPTGLPVYSLYSETREPTEKMLKGVDTIIFDLQVTGCRIYTYKYTLAACLRAAKKYDKKVVILDRPNPLGGVTVEGNVLEKTTESFVGEFPIPMRHGLSMAEAGLFFNQTIQANLEVVALKNWNPKKQWTLADRQWVLTSPNLPSLDTAYTFPGMVLLEGTNISEGRGTCLPFLFIGAPYISNSLDFVHRVSEIGKNYLDGIHLRATEFQPAFHKWQGEVCRGLQIHVTDASKIRSYKLALAIIHVCHQLGEDSFQWKQPPYEYNYDLLPIKILMGSHQLPEKLTADELDLEDPCWTAGAEDYIAAASDILLYDRELKLH